jgi:Tol biopolymer transport system component
VYDPSGYVLFTRGPTNAGVWAIPFSLERLDRTGEPFLVVPNGYRESVAHDGTLIYSGGTERTALQLAWVDREGREVGKIGTPMQRMDPFASLAPDGIRIGVSTMDTDSRDIWILDAVRGTKTRYTFEPGSEVLPVWSPDGARIMYHATPKGCADAACWSVVMRAADGSGDVDTLAQAAGFASISPDGRTLLYTSFASGMRDLWTMPIDKSAPAAHFLHDTGSMTGGQISPDGRYVAYVSEESGHREIYLRRFPAGEGKWQVSLSGGMWPRWSGRGDRLYYTQGDDIMEVEANLGDSPTLGTPRKLFTRDPLGIGVILGWDAGFDVTTDGTRFVIPKNADAGAQSPGITVVQNWLTGFKGERSGGRR